MEDAQTNCEEVSREKRQIWTTRWNDGRPLQPCCLIIMVETKLISLLSSLMALGHFQIRLALGDGVGGACSEFEGRIRQRGFASSSERDKRPNYVLMHMAHKFLATDESPLGIINHGRKPLFSSFSRLDNRMALNNMPVNASVDAMPNRSFSPSFVYLILWWVKFDFRELAQGPAIPHIFNNSNVHRRSTQRDASSQATGLKSWTYGQEG